MSPKLRLAPRRAAFTIVETLTALALLVLLMGSILTFMLTVRERRSRVVGLAGSTRDVLAMLDQLESDLTTAVASDAREGAGVVGDESSIRVIFRSVWLRGAQDAAKPRDLQGATYAFDPSNGRVHGERWGGSHDAPGAMDAVLCAGVGRLEARYFDGRAWAPTFDSVARGGLPAAIEVRVWGAGREQDGAAADWMRIIRIPDAGVTP
jgi:hypothetical protein